MPTCREALYEVEGLGVSCRNGHDDPSQHGPEQAPIVERDSVGRIIYEDDCRELRSLRNHQTIAFDLDPDGSRVVGGPDRSLPDEWDDEDEDERAERLERRRAHKKRLAKRRGQRDESGPRTRRRSVALEQTGGDEENQDKFSENWWES